MDVGSNHSSKSRPDRSQRIDDRNMQPRVSAGEAQLHSARQVDRDAKDVEYLAFALQNNPATIL